MSYIGWYSLITPQQRGSQGGIHDETNAHPADHGHLNQGRPRRLLRAGQSSAKRLLPPFFICKDYGF